MAGESSTQICTELRLINAPSPTNQGETQGTNMGTESFINSDYNTNRINQSVLPLNLRGLRRVSRGAPIRIDENRC
jgi:predicted nuclease with RNAse H fold